MTIPPLPQRYPPAKWYWLAANRPGVVFSSAAPGWIAPSDATYTAWLAAGNAPTQAVQGGVNVLTDGEIADVLVKAGVPNAAVMACGVTSFGNVPVDSASKIVQAIGVAVTSTGTPASDATYEISGSQWQDMRDEAQYVQTYGAFSGGLTTLTWIARSGVVSFASTAAFLAVVKGLADYLTPWKVYFATGMSGTMPPLGTAAIA